MSGTFMLLKDCAPASILSCSELKQAASGPPCPGGSNCFTACAPGSVQAAIEAVIGGLHGSGKSPPHLRNLLLRMRGAGAGCLAAPPTPPNLLALTPHFSLLGLSSPLESIAWVNVCLGVRCVFHSCREDKKGEEKRGLE